MLKWIIIGFIFYIIAGFSTCLIIQIHDSKVDRFIDKWSSGHLEPVEIFGVTLMWPIFAFSILLMYGIPKLFMGMYKLFVLIIFLIGALFTKGDKNGSN